MKSAQKNVKELKLEKENFLQEITLIKNDLQNYENMGKNNKQYQMKIDSFIKFHDFLLKVIKKDVPKNVFSNINQMITNFHVNLQKKKALKVEDLNNSSYTTKPKRNCSLSLSNKSQKSSKGSSKTKVNTSMFCLNKKLQSPLIKSQKSLLKTDNSSCKKRISAKKTPLPSPLKASPHNIHRNLKCSEPLWTNEKLCDIQNVLHSARTEDIGVVFNEGGKENEKTLSNLKKKQQNNAKNRYEM